MKPYYMASTSEVRDDPFSNENVLKVAKRAVAKAIEKHRRLGQPIVVWRDGKPTWIAAEDIPPLDEESQLLVSPGI